MHPHSQPLAASQPPTAPAPGQPDPPLALMGGGGRAASQPPEAPLHPPPAAQTPVVPLPCWQAPQ